MQCLFFLVVLVQFQAYHTPPLPRKKNIKPYTRKGLFFARAEWTNGAAKPTSSKRNIKLYARLGGCAKLTSITRGSNNKGLEAALLFLDSIMLSSNPLIQGLVFLCSKDRSGLEIFPSLKKRRIGGRSSERSRAYEAHKIKSRLRFPVPIVFRREQFNIVQQQGGSRKENWSETEGSYFS